MSFSRVLFSGGLKRNQKRKQLFWGVGSPTHVGPKKVFLKFRVLCALGWVLGSPTYSAPLHFGPCSKASKAFLVLSRESPRVLGMNLGIPLKKTMGDGANRGHSLIPCREPARRMRCLLAFFLRIAGESSAAPPTLPEHGEAPPCPGETSSYCGNHFHGRVLRSCKIVEEKSMRTVVKKSLFLFGCSPLLNMHPKNKSQTNKNRPTTGGSESCPTTWSRAFPWLTEKLSRKTHPKVPQEKKAPARQKRNAWSRASARFGGDLNLEQSWFLAGPRCNEYNSFLWVPWRTPA